MNLHYYSTIIFDCDGVLLDSNSIKTQAFEDCSIKYGELASRALVEYHQANGGISRYKKFSHFIDSILPCLGIPLCNPSKETELSQLLKEYSDFVLAALLSCPRSTFLESLRISTSQADWFVVSGGDQSELRHIFNRRNLVKFFDGGIYGSPVTKVDILTNLIEEEKISKPALYIGDSKYDFVAASHVGLDFVFVSGWTDVREWLQFCDSHSISHVPNLHHLLR